MSSDLTPGDLAEWVSSGWAIDVILALVVLEALALIGLRRFAGRGPMLVQSLPNLLSGAALLVALRLALGQAWWGWTAICLALAFAAHLLDLVARWPRRRLSP